MNAVASVSDQMSLGTAMWISSWGLTESPATWSYGFGMKCFLKSSCIESFVSRSWRLWDGSRNFRRQGLYGIRMSPGPDPEGYIISSQVYYLPPSLPPLPLLSLWLWPWLSDSCPPWAASVTFSNDMLFFFLVWAPNNKSLPWHTDIHNSLKLWTQVRPTSYFLVISVTIVVMVNTSGIHTTNFK